MGIETVAITGAAGFLGQLARKTCEEKGLRVVGIDRAQPRCQGGPMIEGSSLVNQSAIDRVCDLSADVPRGLLDGCDCLIHLAADGRPSADFMQDVLPNNIVATYKIFEEARAAGVKRVIFASTNHTQCGELMSDSGGMDMSRLRALGGPASVQISDALTRTGPDSFYAVSKLCGEGLGYLYARVFKAFEFVALRIGWCLYDRPTALIGDPLEDYLRSMWLSTRDFCGFLCGALDIDLSEPPHRGLLVAYAVSRNGRRLFEIDESVRALGYEPLDDAETYFA